jgi:hypothetical protein
LRGDTAFAATVSVGKEMSSATSPAAESVRGAAAVEAAESVRAPWPSAGRYSQAQRIRPRAAAVGIARRDTEMLAAGSALA